MSPGADRPGLRPGVRLVHDPVRNTPALLYPEGVLLLNESAAATVALIDGERSVRDIVAALGQRYGGLVRGDIEALLQDLTARRLIGPGGSAAPRLPAARESPEWTAPRKPVPLGLIAELTYRCPLHCTYCANPVALGDYADELATADWLRVLDQARALGVLQLHLSGGEPLLRKDLGQVIRHAHGLGLYTNLITSGIPLTEAGLAALAGAGLDHVQLSLQDGARGRADLIAGRPAHDRKVAVAGMVRRLGLPLTVNVVLHRSNVDNIAGIVDLAAELGAERLELAHTQFYGWAWRNRAALAPTADQVAAADRAAELARRRYSDRLELVYVTADYRGGRPKPCMNGWGTRQLVVAPDGTVLPCLSAGQLPGPAAPTVRTGDLADSWYGSELFNRYRGTQWLPEPCQSCPLKTVDFGGCRCQAYQLTGDAGRTDPACELSPQHHLVTEAVGPGAGSPVALAMPRRMR